MAARAGIQVALLLYLKTTFREKGMFEFDVMARNPVLGVKLLGESERFCLNEMQCLVYYL